MPLPEYTQTILNSFKETHAEVFGFGKTNPELFLASAAAAVIAPLFMKDDNRGYLKTSLITTPTIVAAAMVAPKLLPTMRSEGRRLMEVVKQVPTDYGFRNGVYMTATGKVSLPEMIAGYQQGRITNKNRNLALREFYSTLSSNRPVIDIEREYETALSGINKLFADPTKRRFLDNAFYRAQLNQAGTAEKAAWKDLTSIAPSYSSNEMSDMIEANSGNINWLRDMTYRVREGLASSGSVGDVFPDMKGNRLAQPVRESFGAVGRTRLAESPHAYLIPEIDAFLNDPIHKKHFNLWAEDFTVVSIPVPNSSINEIVALNFKNETWRGSKGLFRDGIDIMTLNAAGGGRVGANFENDAVSRMVIKHEGRLNAPVHLIQALKYGPGVVKQEQDKLQWTIGRHLPGSEKITNRMQSIYALQGIAAGTPDAFPLGPGKTGPWSALDPAQLVAETKHLVTNQPWTRVFGGTYNGLFEDTALRFLDPSGKPSVAQESLAAKAANKPVDLLMDERATRGFSTTDFIDRPSFGVRTAELTNSQVAFFSELPEWSESELGESTVSRMIEHMRQDRKVSLQEAEVMWNKMVPFLSNKENYEAARNFGYLGDGSRILKRNTGVRFLQQADYTVSESAVTQAMLDGGDFGPNRSLGWNRGVAVYADGHKNRILSHAFDPVSGEYSIKVEREYGPQGMKTHASTKTTVGIVTGDVETERMSRTLNAYYNATGSGARVGPDVTSFMMGDFNSAKAKNPMTVLQDALGGTLRDLEGGPAGTVPAWLNAPINGGPSHMDRLRSVGLEYTDGQIVNVTSRMGGEREAGSLYLRTTKIIEKMFDDIGEGILKHQIAGGSFMSSYRDWYAAGNQKSYLDYLTTFNLPETLSPSDHMAIGHPSQSRITRDVLQQMGLADDHYVAKEIFDSLESDGSTSMTLDFLNHIDPRNRDYTAALGDVISLQDAIGGGEIKLNSAQGRGSSIFDPMHPRTQQNFSVKVEVGDQTFMVPGLGREAYQGKANPHDLVGYSPNKIENEFYAALDAGRHANDSDVAASHFVTKLKEYEQTAIGKIGLGKESVLRAPAIAPDAFAGRLAMRASTARYADNTVNHFEIGIGDTYFSQMAKADVDTLKAGGRVHAALLRQPISAVPETYVKWDPHFNGTNQIGVSPVLAGVMVGDADGDRIIFNMLHNNTEIIRANLESKNSTQARMASFIVDVLGGGELNSGSGIDRPLRDFQAMAAKFADQKKVASIVSRTSAAAVGMLSNTQDLLEIGLAHNDLFRDPLEKLMAHKFTYDIVREASISAQKLKEGRAYNDMSTLVGWNNQIRSTLRSTDVASENEFVRLMTEGAANFGKEVQVTPEARMMFDLPADLATHNPYTTMIEKNPDMLRNMFRGFDREIPAAAELMTMSSEAAAKYKGSIREALRADLLPITQAYASRGADLSATAIGDINAVAKNAGKVKTFARRSARAAEGVTNQAMHAGESVVGSVRNSRALAVLGTGIGIASLAGLVTGSIHSPREGQALAPDSGNEHRPEEDIGTDGNIPGEPEAGTMAPGNPPRRIRQASQGVRTAIVAPMGRATELEVHMKADDRGRAAEAGKLATRMASSEGNSHVTINYRDTTRLDSLRTRDKIREARNES